MEIPQTLGCDRVDDSCSQVTVTLRPFTSLRVKLVHRLFKKQVDGFFPATSKCLR
jgi:hypothetical protein